MDISKIVNEFETKNSNGFSAKEIEQLLLKFPNLDRKKYDYYMLGKTCIVIDNEPLFYHNDIIIGIYYGLKRIVDIR